MKSRWTRLAQMALKLGGNTRFMKPRLQTLFLRHHKNACEIVLSKDGEPLAAVYFTPEGMHPEFLRSFMQALRDRVSDNKLPQGES